MGNVEQLIIDFKESLEREMGALRHELKQGFTQLNSRFDAQAEHLDRLADLIEHDVARLNRRSP